MKAIKILQPLTYNAGVIYWYKNQLKRLVRIMRKATERRLKEICKQAKPQIKIKAAQDYLSAAEKMKISEKLRKFLHDEQSPYSTNPVQDITTFLNNAEEVISAYFDEESYIVAGELLKKINTSSETNLKSNLKKFHEESGAYSIKGELLPSLSDGVQIAIEASIVENVNYIKTINTKYFSSLRGEIMRMINGGGMSLTELGDYISSIGARSERHAELMAQDQVRKAYTAVNVRRMEDVGIKKFKWLHTHSGAQPRKYHMNTLNGQIFDIDNPPVIDPRTGEKGLPAQLPYCKCVMQPIVELPEIK